MKSLFFTVLFSCFYLKSFNQSLRIFTSAGVLRSDVISDSGDDIYGKGNTPKIGKWINAGINIDFFRYFSLETAIVYQERKALEVFDFLSGDSLQQILGVGGHWVFSEWPTSPQSKGFEEPRYIHFPNFKYLNFEVIPKFKFGRKIEVEAGLGLFYGILLNQNKVTVTKDDLPHGAGFFAPPFNVYGDVKYHKNDFGFVPKIGVHFQIPKSKFDIGLSFKYYHSKMRMNDTFVYSDPFEKDNVFWRVLFAGFELRYKL